MARYGQEFKDSAEARLRPPECAPVDVVPPEIGWSVPTLERARSETLSMPSRAPAWTASARLEEVLTTAVMDETANSA